MHPEYLPWPVWESGTVRHRAARSCITRDVRNAARLRYVFISILNGAAGRLPSSQMCSVEMLGLA